MSHQKRSDEFSTVPLGKVCCSSCGQVVINQSSRQTQLNASCFVTKRHPRIRLRGQIDSLHSLVLMAQHRAVVGREEWLAQGLGELAAYCRELVSAEYNERQARALILDNKSAIELHAASHNPGSLGIKHLLPDSASPEMQHWLNMIRSKSREVELTAYDAFPSDNEDFGASIVGALNIVSSAVYYLQLRYAAEG
jgi:ethanolamine utilization cobalamin adenosyltransferase